MNKIDAKTKLYCLIGDPVEHSLSPAIHNAAFAVCGINAVYLAMRVEKENLECAMNAFRALGVRGMNVTMPHKTEVIKYLDGVVGAAKETGAVNTIVNKGGRLIGYNTDAEGAIRAIKSCGMKELKGKKAVVLGAGGAAKAVISGLAKEGCEIIVLARDAGKACKELGNNTGIIAIKELDKDNHNLLSAILSADILCNCTPVGMHGNETPVPASALRKNPKLIVFDVVYKPGGTLLVHDSKAAGLAVISGEEMLANQGALSFELWTGKKPDKEILLGILREKLNMDAQTPRKKNIYLIGMMGSGKTSVGLALAEKTGMKFVDADCEIKKTAGKKINRIFADGGEAVFRQFEIDAINILCKKENCIVALGGGAVTNSINVLRIKESGKVVLLDANPIELAKRLDNTKDRPLLFGLNQKQKITRLTELMESRKSAYMLAKDIGINTNKKNVKEIADELIILLGISLESVGK